MIKPTLHLIANAHLDPVWLWDWREGLNEGIITSRTILDLMDEYPELTCIRGEAVIYDHIEKHDPATFRRIRKMVAAGRWDIVGGTWLQPDTNLSGTETLCRHFLAGRRYFREKFNKTPEVAWAADSFGHSAGLPEILAAAGMKGIAFTRTGSVKPSKPAFWWEGPSGRRVLAYRPARGWYGCERHGMTELLDQNLDAAGKCDLENVGIFYGLGNHGGGPTRKMIEDIQQWQVHHPEVRVIHSGLHRFFAALFKEASCKGTDIFPVHNGELNFCLRGCYASVAKFKYAYRKAEAQVSRAETTAALVSTIGGLNAPVLTEEWKSLLFNSFHDILPGSSIERAYDDQIAWLGHGMHLAQSAEHDAMRHLSAKIDTQRSWVPEPEMPGSVQLLVWNTHSRDYDGPLELEASLDYRPIWEYKGRPDMLPVKVWNAAGKPIPFQKIRTEQSGMADFPWRIRVALNAHVPAWGWSLYEIAWVKYAEKQDIKTPVSNVGRDGITNGIYSITAHPGAPGIMISRKGKPVFGKKGMGAATVHDPWGSWGGMEEEPESIDLSKVMYIWKIVKAGVLEHGPLRAVLGVRLAAGKSTIDLVFSLFHGRDAIDISVRMLMNEDKARIRITMPVNAHKAAFEVPGGVVERKRSGEVPGGRWVRAGALGFCSDALYSFDLRQGVLSATLARATRYADDRKPGYNNDPWRPVVDRGELRCGIILSGDTAADLYRFSQELEQPVVMETTAPHDGVLPRTGSVGRVCPESLQVLAVKGAESGKGLVIRLRETAGKKRSAFLHLGKRKIALGTVDQYQIVSFNIHRQGSVWHATRITTAEEKAEKKLALVPG